MLPTLLELCGIDPPAELDGVPQLSLDGTSLVPVLHDVHAPTPRVTQYYECWGSRAMYHDGWKSVTNHVNQLTAAEREQLTGSHDFADDTWALYDTRADPTETHDLAAEHPDRLEQLVALWFAEAERNQVFPLDDGAMHRIAHMHVPWTAFRSTFALRAGDKVHEVAGPNIAGGFRMVAAFRDGIGPVGLGRASCRAADAAVLCEQGDWTSGWAWYIAGGALHWCIAGKGGVHGVEAALSANRADRRRRGPLGRRCLRGRARCRRRGAHA